MPVTAPASEWSRTVPRKTHVPPAAGSATKATPSPASIASPVTRTSSPSRTQVILPTAVGWLDERPDLGVRRRRHLERRPAVPRDPTGAPVLQRAGELGARPAGGDRDGLLLGGGPAPGA